MTVVNSHSTRKGRKSDFHKAEECLPLLAWRNCQIPPPRPPPHEPNSNWVGFLMQMF